MNILKKIKISSLTKLIIIFLIICFVIGVMFGFKINVDVSALDKETTMLEKTLECFVFNFWFVFILWILGKGKSFFVIDFILIFLKNFLLGIIFCINLKAQNYFSFFKYFVIDLFLLETLYGYILYTIIKFHFDKNNKIKYDLIIMILLIWVIIYSLACGIIGSKI